MLAGSTLPSCAPAHYSPWFAAAVMATTLGALAFVVLYQALTRGAWRRSEFGWHAMSFMVVILIVCSLAVTAVLGGASWPYRDTIRTHAWLAVALCLWWRVVLLVRAQYPEFRAGRRRRRTTGPEGG